MKKHKTEFVIKTGSIVYNLFRLSNAFLICSFFYILSLFLLFIIGNFQTFLDISQILILKVLSFTSIISIGNIIIHVLILPFLIIFKKFKLSQLWSYLFSFIILIISLVGLFFSQVIDTLSKGL